MNKKQQKQQLQQLTMKLSQGLNGIYYKEYRRAQLLSAYDSIDDLVKNNKNCAREWYALRNAARDTVISFSSRSSLTTAIENLEKALHE